MRQTCPVGWKVSVQLGKAHHAEVSTEDELLG